SVPATTQPALPAIDRDADALIADLFNRYPEARYRITQLAFVQEHALVEAQNRLKRMDWELQQAQQAAQHPPQQQQSGGLFGGLFGGRSQPQPPPSGGPWGPGAAPGYQQQPPPPPQYPPGYQPGLFQRQGSGFLGSALTTAAGVAGGVLAADAIRDMFSPRQGVESGGFPGGTASPWGAPAADPGYVDQGSWTAPDQGAAAPPDQGYVDSGSWDQSGGADPGTWTDPSTDPSGGGWDPGSSDPGSDPGNGGTDDSLT
ncbi:MAG TPA: DUF2076 family protein, partial [Acetobacteraceae bacterium]